MRIGIDARFFGPEGTGIGRYVEKLLVNLEKIDQKNEYLVFLRKNNYFLFNPVRPNFQKIKADASWYSVKEQIIMPAALSRKKLDLIHFPHFNIPLLYPGKFVVTIHDLTLNTFSGKQSSTRIMPVRLTKQTLYRFTISQAIRRAEKILTPSNFVKKEIARELGISANKIAVTYEAAEIFPDESKNSGKIKEVFSKFSIKQPYFIYVGTAYPHKNIDRLIESLNYVDNDLKLVFVSAFNSFTERLREKVKTSGLQNRFVATGSITDQDLGVLLQKAVCLVQPSLSEGFGLTGLEAMEAGCPVASANKSSLPEIYGDAALYFNPLKPKDIAEKINKVFSDKNLQKELKNKGKLQAKKYSWLETAKETLRVYEEVYENKKKK